MPPKNSTSTPQGADRDAAANIVRGQLDALYDTSAATPRPQAIQPAPTAATATTGQGTVVSTDQAEHMRQYHNQWQRYYQEYYERYYVGHLQNVVKEQERAKLTPEERRDEDLLDLRQKIVQKATASAKKARKSRHFIPLLSAFIVVSIVAFLQYNEILIANVQAYISPGAIDPQNIIVDPTANVQVSADPKLIIPKINVDVPMVYGVGYDYASQMKAMQKGVAHFAIPGANAVPGQIGNTVFAGHSSNDLFDPGDYKFIFAQLDKLSPGDPIYINYNSVRYSYTVTKTEVVMPTQVDKLTYKTDKPVLTLITCTPLGTAQKRLLVTAEQISPDPLKATAANTTSGSGNGAVMTGNGPSALERLFGAQ